MSVDCKASFIAAPKGSGAIVFGSVQPAPLIIQWKNRATPRLKRDMGLLVLELEAGPE
jgi:hypothetical protein